MSSSAQRAEARGLQVAYLGHATLLIELDGVRILTDPLLRGRVAHLRRRHAPAEVGELGRLDLVLLSHAHRDHVDVLSLRRLSDPRVLAPEAVVRSLRRRGYLRPVEPIAVGEERVLRGVAVRATPAAHGRTGSAVGFVLAGSLAAYFAGDTAVFPEMAALGPLDLALLPIWGWGPTLGPGHMDPAGAVEAARLLRPRIVVPIHWGTLHPVGMSRHAFLDEPAVTFARLMAEEMPEVEVRMLDPGESLILEPQ